MKKQYTGLKAEKVSFKLGDDIITTSPSCIQIVANTVLPGTSTCSNPTDTTAYVWYGNNPYGD